MKSLPVAVAALLLLAACDDGPETPGFQGYVEGDYLNMAAVEGGWIDTIEVTRGQRVAPGDALFTLEDLREKAAVAEATARLAQSEAELADLNEGLRPEEITALEAQLAEAAASLVLARHTLEREERLVESRTVAAARLDEARAQADQAERPPSASRLATRCVVFTASSSRS